MAKSRIGRVEKILCAHCNTQTKHEVVGEHTTSDYDEDSEVHFGGEHDLMVCNGCGSVTYRVELSCSEDMGQHTYEFYPPRGEPITPKVYRTPKHFANIPWETLDKAYNQTITAFNSDLHSLTGMGIRLLVEGICEDKEITDGPLTDPNTGVVRRDKNLVAKINGLAEANLITTGQASELHELRILGNDSAHNLYNPSKADLRVAIDIVEHIFEQVYEQPVRARVLASRNRPGKP